MDRIIGDTMDKIMCKNCNRVSYYDYYGFCNISCCADFAHKYNLSVEEATDDIRAERIEELERSIKYIENDRDYYEEMAEERGVYEMMYNDARADIELLEKFKHAEKALKVHREMEEVRNQLYEEGVRVGELGDKITKLEEICQNLRTENKILNSKFTRYEIIDLF